MPTPQPIRRAALSLLIAVTLLSAGPAMAADTPAAPARAATGPLPDVSDPFFYLRAPVLPETLPETVLKAKNDLAPSIHPANGEIVNQNPPVFRWPPNRGVAAWEVKLAGADGKPLERMTADNWLFLGKALAPGRYRWQVRAWPKEGAAGPYSAERHFTVPLNAHAFLVPDAAELFQKAAKTAHPRDFPTGEAREKLLKTLTEGERKTEFAEFLRRLDKNFVGGELLPEPPQATWEGADLCESAKIARVISKTVYTETAVARFAAYAWLATGETRYRDEALRRVRHLLSWNPDGSTGQRSHGHGSREIAFTLARVLDLTWGEWQEDERKRVIDDIVFRGQELYDHHLAAAKQPALQEMPYNSHAYRHAGGLLAIAAVLAGDVERVRQWWMNLFPVYVAFNNPWGGGDGGFGNGLGYASWNTEDFLRHWDVLRQVTGVDVAQMAWPQEVGMFLNYFATPETPDGIFGDGAAMDLRGTFETLAQMYAQRVPKPVYARYASRWGDRGWRDTSVLFGPLSPQGKGKLLDPGPISDMPDGVVFPSIGWVAMHSDLEDPLRNSIYFISSPYGSFNHSYAAQNSFVVHSKRRPLAITSGYYDYYRSPHRDKWTKQTLAQNAITFDGGEGQVTDSKSAAGEIAVFKHRKDWDVAVGDATAAYGGKLEKARRTLLFLRPDTAVIYDSLKSATPRSWEWNLHALQQMTPLGDRSLRLEYEDAMLCVDMVAGPPMSLRQTDAFTAEPEACLGDWPKQWHATFATREPTSSAGLLTVLRIGCHTRLAEDVAPKDGGGYSLTLGGRHVTIDDNGAEVR